MEKMSVMSPQKHNSATVGSMMWSEGDMYAVQRINTVEWHAKEGEGLFSWLKSLYQANDGKNKETTAPNH